MDTLLSILRLAVKLPAFQVSTPSLPEKRNQDLNERNQNSNKDQMPKTKFQRDIVFGFAVCFCVFVFV